MTAAPVKTAPILVLQAYCKLLHLDLLMLRGDFQALYLEVRDYPTSDAIVEANTVTIVCRAVDRACTWYWKEALCLQRSAATACLLKRYGVAARLIIGARQAPRGAHAWVEVDGLVANDVPYMREIYAVLDEC